MSEAFLKSIFKVRGLIMVPPMIFITLCTAGEWENNLAVFGGGGAVFMLGLSLRVWAQMHLRYRLRTHKILTVTGPYAYVRNPIYIANTAILLGACMLAELFWFLPIQLLWCAVIYTFVVRYEEARLAQKHGDAYRAYLARVPRWLPKFSPSMNFKPSTREYIGRSLLAEVHNLAILLPFVVKEIFCH